MSDGFTHYNRVDPTRGDRYARPPGFWGGHMAEQCSICLVCGSIVFHREVHDAYHADEPIRLTAEEIRDMRYGS